MSRGRPFEPGNKLGRGRPKGRPNQKTRQAQELFEQNSAAIMALGINRSREDRQMLRMLVSRIVPRQKDWPVKIGRLPMSALPDLDRASEVTIQNAISGKISLSDAREISNLIETRRRVLLAQELNHRLTVLENGAKVALDQGSRKKFVGTLEELLVMYKEMTMNQELDENQDPGGTRAA